MMSKFVHEELPLYSEHDNLLFKLNKIMFRVIILNTGCYFVTTEFLSDQNNFEIKSLGISWRILRNRKA